MQEIDLKNLKLIELELLKQFKEICEQEGFNYSLGGGTLLGAIRHKGFIPWDDDIDVNMPRPDYNKFIEYCKKNKTPFRLVCHETDSDYWLLFAKISDPNTILIDEDNHNIGINIDIFPFDSLDETLLKAKFCFLKSELFRDLLIAKNYKSFRKSKTHNIFYELFRYFLYLASRQLSAVKLIKFIEKQYSTKDFYCSNYSACLCGAHRFKEIMPTSVFTDLIEVEFERESFKAYKNYDTYLKALYGNYMDLPPDEKQVSHHVFKAYHK